MTRAAKRNVSIAGIFLLLACWWWHGWNFDDRYVAGEYVAKSQGERNVLVLNGDHSFSQEVWKGDRTTLHANGTWRRLGEGGVAFSNNFIGAPADAKASDTVYATLDNTFGFHTLTLDSHEAPIKFHKKLFS